MVLYHTHIALLRTLIIFTAVASQYAPGVMERVVNLREKWGQIPDSWSGHYAAVESCEQIGEVIWAKPLSGGDWVPIMVADCSGDEETSKWMLENNIYLEIDYDLAEEWNTVGHGKVVIISLSPPELNDGKDYFVR